MPSNGVIRSFTVANGRKVISIKPAAMHTAKQAAKKASAKKSEVAVGKLPSGGRDVHR